MTLTKRCQAYLTVLPYEPGSPLDCQLPSGHPDDHVFCGPVRWIATGVVHEREATEGQ